MLRSILPDRPLSVPIADIQLHTEAQEYSKISFALQWPYLLVKF
jgi:hypothetical protein